MLPYLYAPEPLIHVEHHTEKNEMMEKDKKAFDNISVSMLAGFEEEFSSSPTLTELRDELLMDYFPIHMPRKGWTEAEWAIVTLEVARALCAPPSSIQGPRTTEKVGRKVQKVGATTHPRTKKITPSVVQLRCF